MATDKGRLTVYLPEDLCRQAKAVAALEGLSLSSYLERLVRADIRNKEARSFILNRSEE